MLHDSGLPTGLWAEAYNTATYVRNRSLTAALDYRNFIYNASLGGMEVLAKVVFPSYNKDVHAHLAAQHMAPQLYGTSYLHDLASVVVMELLKDDWTTLFHYRNNVHRGTDVPKNRRERLLKLLEEILDCLSARGTVHGDFRMSC